MAVITPNSDVILLKVPLEIDENNQLTFANATAQYNYFYGLAGKRAFDKFTYQRKDNTIRVPALIDDLYQYNYVMYRNTNHSSKWFYAFITDMSYVSDGVTAISIKTDVWQTWQFDLTYKATFVEREHVNDDTIGAHTIDEDLDVGEYVINTSTTLKPDVTVKDNENVTINWIYPIVFQVTELVGTAGGTSQWYDSAYNNVFSGLYYFACCSYADARSIINQYDSAGKGDAIIAIFLAPKEFFNGAIKISGNGSTIYIPADSSSISTLLESTTISRPSKLNGYTPKNNKMFTYPYSYLYVTNNVGNDNIFRYEDFATATPKFLIGGSLGQGCTTKLCPISYKGYTTNAEVFEYGVTGAKYPVCAWSSDYYTNWVTQNAANQANTLVKAGVGAAAGAAFGGVGAFAGGAISLLTAVASNMAKKYEASVIPDQAKGNTNTSDILIGWQRYFTVDCMSVRAEIAKVIDDYFSVYGYKVNSVKVPNVTGRTNWNFVKTIGCYILADIPQTDLAEIKSMFDKGITFWHNPNTFMDYSQSNAIVTP